MAVDLNPAEGRIILGRGRSTEFFPWYEAGGKITKVVGKRVYYTAADGSEKFLHEFSAVVDTKEEAQLLLDFSVNGRQAVQELRATLDADASALVDSMNAAPVKRSRVRHG